MDGTLAILAGGVLLGLAGSMHCACMCGGIASGALFIFRPETARQRVTTLLLTQGGRIVTYAIAGGAAASLSSMTVDPNSTAMSYRVLQWLGAVVLMWAGLSTAGLLPRLSIPGGGGASLTAYLNPVLVRLRKHPRIGPFAVGVSWGFTPCPMVYAALFTAALAGSFAKGALWMLAFGLGTLPGVIGAALGISALSRKGRGPAAEMGAGVLIAAFGFATLYFGWPASNLFCITR
ncbi:MAG: sulfite exporter TauE/SafE family protein [Hyphomicrobium sp.]